MYIYIVKLSLPSDKKKFVLPILQFELEEERDQVLIMSGSKRWSMGLRFVVFLFLVLLAMASMGDCIRELKEWDFKSTFEGQLPRGPVPPSGPSPCHNKLSPYNQSEFSLPNDYVICP